MDHRTRLLDDNGGLFRKATQAYLSQYIVGTCEIGQELLDSTDEIVKSIKAQDCWDANAEAFLNAIKEHGTSSLARLDRLESLTRWIRNAETGDIVSALYTLRLSFDRLQAILGT
jgi:hypothetical protein